MEATGEGVYLSFWPANWLARKAHKHEHAWRQKVAALL